MISRRRSISRRHGGWVFIDIVFATMLVATLSGLMMVAASSHAKGQGHLADTRAAMRLAEAKLIALQTGAKGPSDLHESIRVSRLKQTSEINGYQWVRVEATVDGRSSSLTGLIPVQQVPSQVEGR